MDQFEDVEYCKECKVEMSQRNDGDLMCLSCGCITEREVYCTAHYSSNTQITTQSNASVKQSRLMENILKRISGANSDIPKDVISAAISQYSNIKKISRSDVLRGMIACLTKYFLASKNIIKTREQLADLFGIKVSDIDRAQITIQEYIESGQIKIPQISKNICETYITQYFRLLHIDEKHFAFAIELFKTIDECIIYQNTNDKSQILRDHKPTTKVTGFMIMFNHVMNLGYKANEIASMHKLSLPTINGYLKVIQGVANFDAVKTTFEKFAVPHSTSLVPTEKIR